MAPHHHSHRPTLHEATQRLRRGAHKVTGQRHAVLDHLRLRSHPVSAKELHEALGGKGGDLATIYRCLNLLERKGMVMRYDLGDGVARFELLSEGDDGHHHHLVCTRCAEVVEIEECRMRAQEERIARRNGFMQVTHRLEFFGICPACQKGPPG